MSYNLEIPEICQELKDSMTMVHVKDVETRSLKCNSGILKDVTRDFTSIEMIWQKDLRKTSMIERSHRRQEQDLKSLATLTLEDQTPVIHLR